MAWHLKYWLLLLILLAPFVSASMPFRYAYVAKTDTIFINETAYYYFNLSNYNLYPDKIQLYTISSQWNIYPTQLTVDPQSTLSFLLEINPLDNRLYGPQLVPVTLKSLVDNKPIVENLYVYIKGSNDTVLQYVPNLAMTVTAPTTIDPRQPASLEVDMRNKNPLDIKDLTILVTSELFNKEFKTSLGPLEEKTNQILIPDLNARQTPGTYNINVKLLINNQTVAESNNQVIIESYSDITVQETETNGLFSTKDTIEVVNNGNAAAIKQVKLQKNFFEKLFTHSSMKYDSVDVDGVSYIQWTVSLDPLTRIDITTTTSYTWLVIVMVLIIAGFISYYVFRSPVILIKNAKISLSTEDGVSEVKVKLHIKNRSGRVIKNIKITDKYPKIVQIEEDQSLGTLKPTKMLTADKTHSMLMWNLELLDPFEERLLTYRLKSKLDIVGNISLHPARIKFQTATGERSYYSNDVTLQHKSHHTLSEEK